MKSKIRLIREWLEQYRPMEDSCVFCPRRCGVNRKTDTGICGEPFEPGVSSINLHHGEEPPVSGIHGSGTVFFTGCNLKCVYCQNFPISQLHQAKKHVSFRELAEMMLNLQRRKAHNINFVTPSHMIYQIVSALEIAVTEGLKIPLVYNTSGYDDPEMIKSLNGIMDIWLPDIKTKSNDFAARYSGASDYVQNNEASVKEMFRQTGGRLILDGEGIAEKGMIIRHLVLPGYLENSKKVLSWITEKLGKETPVALMSQYFPAHHVCETAFEEINRSLSMDEYEVIVSFAEELGLENTWIQPLSDNE